MYCDNPFFPDCPSRVEKEMPGLCEMRQVPPGEYGEKPHWTWEHIIPIGLGMGILAFTINHIVWNWRYKENDG